MFQQAHQSYRQYNEEDEHPRLSQYTHWYFAVAPIDTRRDRHNVPMIVVMSCLRFLEQQYVVGQSQAKEENWYREGKEEGTTTNQFSTAELPVSSSTCISTHTLSRAVSTLAGSGNRIARYR